MSCLDEVPFKTLLGSLEGPREEVELITAPDITVPDYLTILQETEVGVCKRLRVDTHHHHSLVSLHIITDHCKELFSMI